MGQVDQLVLVLVGPDSSHPELPLFQQVLAAGPGALHK